LSLRLTVSTPDEMSHNQRHVLVIIWLSALWCRVARFPKQKYGRFSR